MVMKTLLLILFISLLSTPSWSETFDDLVKREGIYYQKFTNVPFNGKVTGSAQGAFKNGKREGAWAEYYENGQLLIKANYKNDKQDGAWARYWKNGQLWKKGNDKNGKRDGAWAEYHENGQLWQKGDYKNGKKISD
jgi:antitoxin component YwqK of YwqJK toxin-antitoxin module